MFSKTMVDVVLLRIYILYVKLGFIHTCDLLGMNYSQSIRSQKMDTQPIIELFSLCKRLPGWSVNVYSTVHYLANRSRNSHA